MVGRGWWLLLWIWFMSLLCALCGSWCRSGEEYYSSAEGRCLPCTTCYQPEMVVSVPCYLYQDAVCTKATQFLPNKKSSITDMLAQSYSSHHKLNSTISQSHERIHSDIRRTDYINESKEKHENFIRISDLNSEIELNNEIDKSSPPSLNNSASEKHKNNKQYHKHRHRHHVNHELFEYLEHVYKEGYASVLNNSVSDSSIKSLRSPVESSHGDLMLVTEANAGATRPKDINDKVVVTQEEIAVKPKTFILYAVVIIGLASVALILIIFIQTRRFLIRQRKTLSSSEHEQPPRSLEESDGSEQLLHPDSISSYSITNSSKKSKKLITYRSVQTKSKPRTFIRPSLISAQQQQSSSVEARPETNTVVDQWNMLPNTEQTTSYPSVVAEIDWPSGQAATMDRLLEERRRIYGQVFPLETNNFYVQQQKKIGKSNFGGALGMSQPCLPHPSTPLLGTRTSHIRGSVSASASPIASRTHRLT